jgi:hypothetical protein
MIGSAGADRRSAGRLGATAPELERVSVQDSGSGIELSGIGRLAQRGEPHAGRRPADAVRGVGAKPGFADDGGAAGAIVGHPDEIRRDRGQVNDTSCHNVRTSQRPGADAPEAGLK